MASMTRCSAAVLVVALAARAEATNGSRLIGFGPVQEAMGGAAVGAPLDAATQVSNPAGLAVVGGQVLVGVTRHEEQITHRGQFAPFDALQREGGSLIPTIGSAVPLGERVALGAGVWQVQRVGAEREPSLTVTRLDAALAWRIDDRLSVGVSANLLRQSLRLADDLRSDRAGASAGVGVLLRVSDTFTVGLAGETPGWFSGTIESEIDGNADLQTPPLVALGVGWRPVPTLLVAADASVVLWSVANGSGEVLSDDFPRRDLDLGWHDQVVGKLGVEWRAAPWLHLRAGVNGGNLPAGGDSYLFPGGSALHVTGGAGVALNERARIDFSYAWSPATTGLENRQVEPDVTHDTRQWSWTVALSATPTP